MRIQAKPTLVTVGGFLPWEERKTGRWELVDGEPRAMTGDAVAHNTIVLNIAAALRRALARGKTSCRVFAENVKVASKSSVLYPDVFVTCGAAAADETVIRDPVAVVEVLSPRTEAQDRGRKWLAYQAIPSLRAYVLVAQNRPVIEIFRRDGNAWRYDRVESPKGTVRLDPLGARLRLADIYRDVLDR
ncbi:MAG: Uma2 family endonuclease [Alphaproteobacteria bacterium]|nr:Uma2 family endonuclease [Alphaproteobacteria bacterium]